MELKAIPTKDQDGKPNGYVLPIWNNTTDTYQPHQLYLTTINVGCAKGPHLHMRRAGRFVCIRGDIVVVTRTLHTYTEQRSGDAAGYHIIDVPPGMACLLVNVGLSEALVLNTPNPAWRPDDQDDVPVIGWAYQPHA